MCITKTAATCFDRLSTNGFFQRHAIYSKNITLDRSSHHPDQCALDYPIAFPKFGDIDYFPARSA